MIGPEERAMTDAERDQAVLDAHDASPCDNVNGLCDAADAILAQRAAEQRSYDARRLK